MERALYFDKYRNIGIEKSERIVLNHSLEKGKMGNLVIIVGANNSGKSNVLAGIEAFGKKQITDRDVTTLSYAPEYQSPSLSMSLKDDDGTDYTCRLFKDGTKKYFYPKVERVNNEYTFADDISILRADIAYIVQALQNHYYNGYAMMHPSYQKFSDLHEYLKGDEEKEKVVESVLLTLDRSFRENPRRSSWWNDFVKNRPQSILAKEYKPIVGSNDDEVQMNFASTQRFGIAVNTQIVNYVEKSIKNSELSCRACEFSSNAFLVAVFAKIGISAQEIQKTYEVFEKQGNKGALTILQRKINERLASVADDFNKMYFVDDNHYSFEVSLESDKIFFSMFRGNNDIILDYQSTGFKWFFNLYFNLLSRSTLNAGDILIMDEPATNLHVMGQIELRKFLKEFAMKNDLTIVIATHSPFLIDIDYLDELRVVSMKDNISRICNDFTAVDADDPDALKPIKTALTVNNHILLDPDKKVVFVEGITDYNYLTAFKKKLNIREDVVFLPIQGLGNVADADIKDQQCQLSKALIGIRKNNPVLLVDGDGAGKSMQEVNSKNSALEVVSLTDIDPAYKQIEDLFDNKDKKKLGIIDENGKILKHSSWSANIKTYIQDYEFEPTTKKNFKKVIEYLVD